MGWYVLLSVRDSVDRRMHSVRCEPITQGSDRLCTRRCVHGQLIAYLLSTSTKLHKLPSTNQMEADQALTNRSKEHRCACGASRTKDLTNSQKGGKALRFQEGCNFFKTRGEETEGASWFFSLPMFDWPGGHKREDRINDCWRFQEVRRVEDVNLKLRGSSESI